MSYLYFQQSPMALCLAVGLAVVMISLPNGGYAQDGVRPVDRAKTRVSQGAAAPEPGTTQKIVGGISAPAGKFPFQTALVFANTPVGSEHFGQFCGGSLIAQNWVLTAAHCVPNTSPNEVDVFIGSTVLPSGGSGSTTESGVRSSVDAIIVHDDYDPATSDNDIALLHITGPIPSDLRTVLTATPEHDEQFAFPLGDALVIGWGATQQGGNTTPQLMRVWVDIQDSKLCQANYQDVLPSAQITDNMLCAGLPEGGQDSCQGDSGGFLGAPLGHGQYVQLGVVSWGVGCAQPKLFGVYTRVSNYADWISEQMSSF
ncbi:MAG: serine protease [Alphaproteobacteria bacterium]|nr:serine protease [Alphaproteobacteria bacterium]